jgi:hypothetical protein
MPADKTKLYYPCSWLGYFIGCKSELIYRIYNPEKHIIQRIGASEIDDSQGLNDSQDGPSLRDITSDLNVIPLESDN